jgi:hypothetical protein
MKSAKGEASSSGSSVRPPETGYSTGAMSTTTSARSSSGCRSASCIDTFPPIECPTSVAGSPNERSSAATSSAMST